MARGKYKSTAEARQVRESALAESARLRREVADLQSQVARLDQENVEQQAAYAARLTELRALLAANTTPKVAELENRVTTASEERDHALIYAGELREMGKRFSAYMHEHFEAEHGMNPTETTQFVLAGLHSEAPDLAVPNVSEAGAKKLKEDTRRRLKEMKASRAYSDLWVQTIPETMP